MTETNFTFDFGSPPKDDNEVAETCERALDVHTDNGIFENLPSNLKGSLDSWMNPYVNRRKAEIGVSPLSPKILDVHLDTWDLEWIHRITESEYEARPHRFGEGSTDYTTVKAKSFKVINKVIHGMKSHGWEVTKVMKAGEEFTIKARFTTVRQDFELVRRLMVAGLSRAEAVSFWATEVCDNKAFGNTINNYLMDSKFRLDKVKILAEALGTSTEAVYMTRNEATEKLKEIDPSLPRFLKEGEGGRPLPDEMWSDTELQRLHDGWD